MRSLFCLSVLMGMALGAPLATTYLVLPDGTGDFPTIQAAVDATLPGDLILLANGTFVGPGNRDIDFNGKDLEVRSQSEDPTRCIIDCGSSGLVHHRGFFFHNGESPAAGVEGVTIANGGVADYGGGIAIEFYSSPTIANCVIRDCSAGYAGGGISCRESCDPIVIGCVFRNNQTNEPADDIIAHGGGMYCGHYCDVVLSGCTFAANRANLRGGGFHCHVYSTALLTNCTFYRNTSLNGANIDVRYASNVTLDHSISVFGEAGSGLNCEAGCDAQVLCSDVYGNYGGDWVGCLEDQAGQNGNLWADPLLCDPANGDFHLAEDSPCGPAGQPCGLIGAWPVGCARADVLVDAPSTRRLDLERVQPNPFASTVTLTYRVPAGAAGQVFLEIHDAAGRLVRRLTSGASSEGRHEIVWNGCDPTGRPVSAGAYFVTLNADRATVRRRILLVR